MNIIQALFLGIVQGITEFLPLSSSGHLELFQTLFGLQDLKQYDAFDLICHLGTLLAVFFVLRQEIVALFFTDRFKMLLISVALLPLVPVYFLLGDHIKALMSRTEYLSLFFLMTAGLLFLGDRVRFPVSAAPTKRNHIQQALMIGTFQALALLPGVPRSGSTISAARMLGWPLPSAINFSFLLLIPAVLGGSALEFGKLLAQETPSQISWVSYMMGFGASFAVGAGALGWLKHRSKETAFRFFAWYCLAMSALCLIFLTL